jgi:hypothetical protein
MVTMMGILKNIAEQVGFAISYEISAYVLFRIDIKDGRARLITTIQEYESVNRGGVAGGQCQGMFRQQWAFTNRKRFFPLLMPLLDYPGKLEQKRIVLVVCI